MPAKAKVFLSYARRDETFADVLRERLSVEAPDITVLKDRLFLEGGISWRRQVERAIESAEFLVLVASGDACRSKEVRWEWQLAREKGVCVYPVMVTGTSVPFDELVSWMRKAHFYDLSHEWPTFLQHLRSPCQAHRVPFMAPPLPDGYIERVSERGALRDLLLDRETGESLHGVVAVRGEGGFGKTMLATAICHDEDVKAAFDDGVLCVTLGESPNVLASIESLHAAITGRDARFASQEDAEYRLREALGKRRCLIVIDDVWNEAHLRAFRGDSVESTWLTTTRLSSVALDARSLHVAEVEPDEAEAMLTRGVEAPDLGAVAAFAARLGRWPLLLGLARAVLRERIQIGDTLERAVSFLSRALDEEGFEAFDQQNAEQRDQALARTIEVSFRLLDEEERRRCLELGVLLPEGEVPLRTAEALWGLGEYATEKRVQRLHSLGLLKLDLDNRTFWLRDAMSAYLARRLEGKEGLHSRLLDAWDGLRQPPDSYAWRFCGHHAAAAGRVDVLRQRLGEPGWIENKLRHTDVQSLLRDFDRLPRDDELAIVAQAIRLGAPHLDRSSSQLRSQLHERLPPTLPLTDGLRREIARARDAAWLRPAAPVLLRAGGACCGTLRSRLDATWTVAVTRDARMAVSAGPTENQVQLWDLERWDEDRNRASALTHAFSAESRDVTALNPVKGKEVLVGCSDGSLRLWNLDTGHEKVIGLHSRTVVSAAASLDGRLAITASGDGWIKLWDLERARELRSMQLHIEDHEDEEQEDEIQSSGDNASENEDESEDEESAATIDVTLTGDGRRAVALVEGTLMVWDVEPWRSVCSIDVGFGASRVAITPDGRHVAVVCGRVGSVITRFGLFPTDDQDEVEVWSIEQRRRVRRFLGQHGWIHTIQLAQESGILCTASSQGSLLCRRPQSRKPPRAVSDPSGVVRSVSVTADGRYALTASEDASLRLWDLTAGRDVGSSRSLPPITFVAIDEDGRQAVAFSEGATLTAWSLATGELQKDEASFGTARSRPIALGRGGRTAVALDEHGQLTVRGTSGGPPVRIVDSTAFSGIPATATPDGNWVLFADWDAIAVVHSDGRAVIGRLRVNPEDVSTAAMTDDGRSVVIGLRDGSVALWDLTALREVWQVPGAGSVVLTDDDGQRYAPSESGELRPLEGHAGWVSAVALTPDGRLTASASDRLLLRTRDGAERWIDLGRRVDSTSALALSADGRWLALTAVNGYVGLLDVEHSSIVAEFGADTALSACAVGHDGTIVVAGGRSGVMHVLRVEPPRA